MLSIEHLKESVRTFNNVTIQLLWIDLVYLFRIITLWDTIFQVHKYIHQGMKQLNCHLTNTSTILHLKF